MKILHVIPGISPAFGGPTKVVFDMCRVLHTCGIETHIATTDADVDGKRYDQLSGGGPNNRDGISVSCFRCNALPRYGFSVELTHWLKQNTADFDLVHIHAFFSYVTPIAAYYARQAGKPYILRPLGQLDSWSLGQSFILKKVFLATLGAKLLRQASAIQVTSLMERSGLQQLGFTRNVVTVPLGVTLTGSDDGPHFQAGYCRALFLGRIDPKKNLPLLLKSIHSAGLDQRRFHLTIAGTGDRGYIDEINNLVDALGLRHLITFLGHVEGRAKDDAFRSSDIFILPSYQENFGVAVAEAMANGLPVIISDRVALADDVFRADAGRVVQTGSLSSLVSALQDVCEAPNAWMLKGRNAKSLARRNFSWTRVAEHLIEMYDSVTHVRVPVGELANEE